MEQPLPQRLSQTQQHFQGNIVLVPLRGSE
jgi:hypothetical protein